MKRTTNFPWPAIWLMLISFMILAAGTLSGCGGGTKSSVPLQTQNAPVRTGNPQGTFRSDLNICDFLFAPYDFVDMDLSDGIVGVGIADMADMSLGHSKQFAEEFAITSLQRQFIAETEALVQVGAKMAKDHGEDESFLEESRKIILDRYMPQGYLYGTRFKNFCVYPDIANAEDVYALAVVNIETMDFTNYAIEIMKSVADVEGLRVALDRSHETMMDTIQSRRKEYQEQRRANPLSGD